MRYWVVKGKPSRFGAEEDYVPGRAETWETGRLPKDISRNDRIFLWLSSPAKRLAALAKVTDVDVGINSKGKTLFDLIYLTRILNDQISISELRQYRPISQASFLKSGPFATIYPLDQGQGESLFRIVALHNPEVWKVWPKIAIREPERVSKAKASSLIAPPSRLKVTVNRIIRDTAESRRLKLKYDNRCQVCNERIEIATGLFYSQVHHIRPLGGTHRGLDHPGNMLVLCPNHHAMFDFGLPRFISETTVRIGSQRRRLAMRHKVDEENISYHNKRIFVR